MKKQITPKELSKKQQMEVLDKYMSGLSVTKLAKEYDMKRVNMEKFIGNTCKKLNIIRETNALVRTQMITNNLPDGVEATCSFNHPALINEKFLTLLSKDSDLKLSLPEETYCVVYSQTGNNKKAIKSAGLDAGLKTTERIQMTVDEGIALRGFYLRRRPVIASAITTLQEENLKELNVSKGFIQTVLIQNINELREEVVDDPKQRGHLLKSIELLGKTITAFTENLRIEQIDPNEALQELIVMAEKEAGVYEPE